MGHLYVLVDHEPVEVPDVIEWARISERRWQDMARTGIDPWSVGNDTIGGWRISTVFLGLDHQWHPAGEKHLFETAVWDRNGEIEVEDRYPTWELAEEGHARHVNVCRALAEAEGGIHVHDNDASDD